MAVDSSSSAEMPPEKMRDEKKNPAPGTIPNDSQPETEVGDGIRTPADDAEPPTPVAKRSVTGFKVFIWCFPEELLISLSIPVLGTKF